MLINFDAIEPAIVKNFRGGEKEICSRGYQDEHCKIMRIVLIPGASVGRHTHVDNCEMMYILSGSGTIIYDGVEEKVGPGSFHYCPKGHEHEFMNDGSEDIVFLAIVPELR